jgi:hypothetical protein
MIRCYQNLKIGAMITISWIAGSINESASSCFLNAAKRNEWSKCIKAEVQSKMVCTVYVLAVRHAVFGNVELR